MKNDIHPVEAEDLMAYLDGELPVERASATAAHLQECRECQIVAAELKSVSESLTAWEVEAREAQMNPELVAALEQHETEADRLAAGIHWNWANGGRFRRFAPWAFGALAGGLATLLVTFAMIGEMGRGEHNVQRGLLVADAPPTPSSVATASPGADRDRLTSILASKLGDAERAQLAERKAQAELSSNLALSSPSTETIGVRVGQPSELPTAPMILRTAQITLVTQNLDKARSGMDDVVRRYNGYVADLSISSPGDGARKLTANLRVPAAQLDAALAELKKLGRVESESQSGQDVTAQYVDLEARLSNARNTEQRLLDLLRQRTGKLSDVLEVETELSRVREEIDRMEGERRLLSKQVEYATLSATIAEEFKAPAQALPNSLGTRFRNAAVDGYQSVVNFVIDVALFLVADGPMLLLWIAILFFPARYAWRKLRNRNLPSSQQ
jgi:anti-sigma factor RsiW